MPAHLLLDIGTGVYGGVLTKTFVDRHSTILNEPPILDGQVGAGVGGAVQVRLTSLSALRIGGLTVPKPIVALPTTTRGFFGLDWVDGTLGAGILRRTRLIVDYPHGEVIIEPAESWEEPFEYDLSGLSLHAAGAELESVIVNDVRSGSPADAAAFSVGDVLRSMDGRAVSGESLDWVTERLMVPNRRYVLGVERDGSIVELEMSLGSGELL
jgi:PDZ domain-containing protein